jgi:hypothetical protein
MLCVSGCVKTINIDEPINVDDIIDSPLYTIYWAVPNVYGISDKAMENITKYLKEHGYDFTIEFVFFNFIDFGTELEEYINDGNSIDIVLTGYFDNAGTHLSRITDGRFMELNDFLEENPDIKNQFPELLWETVTYNNSIFALPAWATYKTINYAFNPDIFYNELYNFSASEQEIIDLLTMKDVSIAMCVDIMSIIPCNIVYGLGFPHCGNPPVNVFSRYLEIFKLLNEKATEGTLTLFENRLPIENEKFDVYIGFTPSFEYINIEVKQYLSSAPMGLAVFSNNPNSDKAISLIKKIYTNSELANLLIYGSIGIDYQLKNGYPYTLDDFPFNSSIQMLSLGKSFYKGLHPTHDKDMRHPQDINNPIEYFNETVTGSPFIGFIPSLNEIDIGRMVTVINVALADSRELLTGENINATEWLEKVNRELTEMGIDYWLAEVIKQYDEREVKE